MADRLTNLVHHISTLCPPDRLGRTRLAKILWLADVEYYRLTGRTITGSDDYRKDEYGPRHRYLYDAIDILLRGGHVVQRAAPTPVGVRQELIPLVRPDVSAFSAEEIAVVDRVAAAVINLSAKDASDLTHDELWDSANYNERIPVAAAAPILGETTPEIAQWAREAFNEDSSPGDGISNR